MAESNELSKTTINNSTSGKTENESPQKSLKDTIKAKVKNRNLSAAPFCLTNGTIHIQNTSNVHIGNSLSVGANSKTNKPIDPKPEITPAITALFENEDEIDNFHRLAVDCHVGSDWRFLGLELAGLSNGQMDQLEEPFKANQYPFREIIYQLLLMWEAQCESRPTVGILAKALWKCKMYSAFVSLLEVVNHSNK